MLIVEHKNRVIYHAVIGNECQLHSIWPWQNLYWPEESSNQLLCTDESWVENLIQKVLGILGKMALLSTQNPKIKQKIIIIKIKVFTW
jgi:hypothetical protein